MGQKDSSLQSCSRRVLPDDAGGRWRACSWDAVGSGSGAAARGQAAHGGRLRACARPRVAAAGAQEAEKALPAFLKKEEEKSAEEEINDRISKRLPVSAAWRQWAGLPPLSSSSSTKGNRRKKRKKQLPKIPSLLPSPGLPVAGVSCTSTRRMTPRTSSGRRKLSSRTECVQLVQ